MPVNWLPLPIKYPLVVMLPTTEMLAVGAIWYAMPATTAELALSDWMEYWAVFDVCADVATLANAAKLALIAYKAVSALIACVAKAAKLAVKALLANGILPTITLALILLILIFICL